MEAEKLKIRLSKLESRLYQEKLNSHRRLNNLGWGYGMRCVKMPTFTKEDNIQEQIDKVKKQIEETE